VTINEIKLPIETQIQQRGFIFGTHIISKYFKAFPAYVNILYLLHGMLIPIFTQHFTCSFT